MKMTTTMTAFNMPPYGISLSLSAYQEFFTGFQCCENLSCANEVSASKQASLYL